MTPPNVDEKDRATPLAKRLPRRDLILIPAISIATIVLMFAVAEVACRMIWVADEKNGCVILDNTQVGYHYQPNCTARTKSAEGQWVTYHFNDCGYRGNTSCKTVPTGTLRIAIIQPGVERSRRANIFQHYGRIA
jgi:hypothetical protein